MLMEQFESFLIPQQEISREKKNVVLVQSLNFNEPETPMTLFDNIKGDYDDNMRIYLRLRPASGEEQDSCYQTPNFNDVIAIPPVESASYRNFIYGYGKTSQKFTFSKLFDGNTNQDIIFEETTKPLLDKFVKGADRLLFTYGTTSSGKTYTMNGQKKNIGIIPRSLIELYNSVQLSNDASIMPVDFSEVSNLSATDVQRILREKTTLLKLSEKESSDVLNFLSDKSQNDNEKLNVINSECKTTFWITYTEIYNENIYDLLDITQCQTNGSNKQLKRPILEIRTARNGGSYVKGLSCYPVFSAEEAYRLLLVGRRSQKVGATRLNQNSSRSHSIFTIRAVRTNTSSRYLTRVANFSFCDLAGSERTDKAQTSGASQKEANNINSSLLALGRCIEILRRNQANPCNMHLVPFRDSKLTRLFQTYLTGNGTASMIVCINPDKQLFDESMQVLKFSALAREVVLQEKEKIDLPNALRRSHFCRLGLTTPAKKSDKISWGSDNDLEEGAEVDATLLEDDDEIEEEEFNEERFLEIIEELKTELLNTKMAKRVEVARVREEQDEYWMNIVKKMENDHSNAIQTLREDQNKRLLKEINNEKKKRKIHYEKSDEDDEGMARKLANSEKVISQLEIQLRETEEERAEYRETADILAQKFSELEVVSRNQGFKLSKLSNELMQYKELKKDDVGLQTDKVKEHSRELSDSSITTIEGDTSCRSSSSIGSRYNRFSSFSTDKKVYVNKSSELPMTSQRFFGPIQSPDNSVQMPEPVTVRKKVFEINEEDIDDIIADDNSFLQHEADFKVAELQSKFESLLISTEQQTKKTEEMKTKLEMIESEKSDLSQRIISLQNTVMLLTDKERLNDIIVDNIAKKMGVLPIEGGIDVSKKLELISSLVTMNRSTLNTLKEVSVESEENVENVVPVRVTRSHNPEAHKRRTRRKK